MYERNLSTMGAKWSLSNNRQLVLTNWFERPDAGCPICVRANSCAGNQTCVNWCHSHYLGFYNLASLEDSWLLLDPQVFGNSRPCCQICQRWIGRSSPAFTCNKKCWPGQNKLQLVISILTLTLQTRSPRQSLSLSQSPILSRHWFSGVQQSSPPQQSSISGSKGLMLVVISVSGPTLVSTLVSEAAVVVIPTFSSQQSMVELSLGRLVTSFLQLLFPQKWPGRGISNRNTFLSHFFLVKKEKPSLQSRLLSQSPSPWPHRLLLEQHAHAWRDCGCISQVD